MDYAIIAEGLTYSYNNQPAVDNISFRVRKGEIFGFLGPNGAGKTTTIKMLIGLLRPKSGKATILDMDIFREVKKIQGKIGVCFEITNLYEQMSAIDNLMLFARIFGINDFNPYELLKRVGLEGREKDRSDSYSKGMKQRLMVARSLVNKPEILFLDEPTAGLDPVSSEEIRNIILKERERGATIILTTHDMWEADKLCDRVAFINQGKIAVLDTPFNLKQQYGKRALKVKVYTPDGRIEEREVPLDNPETSQVVSELFQKEKVITVHTEEATMEDIFIKITGRSLL